jgi:hypothetical protein
MDAFRKSVEADGGGRCKSGRNRADDRRHVESRDQARPALPEHAAEQGTP